jgi:hypothetical protein
MRYSTIIPKKKTLNCGHFDFNFSKGRCKQCATIESTEARFQKSIKIAKEDVNKKFMDKVVLGADFVPLDSWFKERAKEMTGTCKHCGGKTQKGQKNYKCSVAHILPKAYFPSVATHIDNWIELCFYGKSCHTNFDHSMIDIIDLNCFDAVIEKFVRIYPSIAKNERKRIPSALMQYIDVES